MGTHEAQRAMRARKAFGAAVLAGGMLLAAPAGVAVAAPATGPTNGATTTTTTGPVRTAINGVNSALSAFTVKMNTSFAALRANPTRAQAQSTANDYNAASVDFRAAIRAMLHPPATG